jgi:hypothetical protein
VEREIMPHTHEWDEKKSLPLELYRKTYEAGDLTGRRRVAVGGRHG